MNKDLIRAINGEALRRNIAQPVTIQTREVSAEGQPAQEFIRGYFSVYNTNYVMWDGYIERIAPGAFDGADISDVLCLFNHDDDGILGRLTNGTGTLMIGFDDKGGYFEVAKNNTTLSQDVYENIKLGNIQGCSFAFTIAEESIERDVPQPDGSMATVYTITKIKKLYDVGPVTNPAYTETEVEASKRNLQSRLPAAPQPVITRDNQFLNIKLNSKTNK